MRRFFCLLACFLSPIASAQIEGPKESDPGDLVVLSAVGEFESCAWTLANSDKSYLPVENNTKVVFASGKPGDYVFVLATSTIDETAGSVTTQIYRHVVTIAGTPQPEPGPDPGPRPEPKPPAPDLSEIAQAAFDAVTACDATSLEKTQAAANLRSTASKAAGLSEWSVEDINADLVTRNRRSPFSDDATKQRWAKFFAWFSDAMQDVQDKPTAIETFNEIADGLEASASRSMWDNVLKDRQPTLKGEVNRLRLDLNEIRSEVGN